MPMIRRTSQLEGSVNESAVDGGPRQKREVFPSAGSYFCSTPSNTFTMSGVSQAAWLLAAWHPRIPEERSNF